MRSTIELMGRIPTASSRRISHDGDVFEKDLGSDGEAVAKAMTLFDPDSSWTEVKEGSSVQ